MSTVAFLIPSTIRAIRISLLLRPRAVVLLQLLDLIKS
jgi:hypothetical protein